MDSDSENSENSENTTTRVPFDGVGRDPQSLVGRKLKWYYKSGKGISLLTFKFQGGTACQFVNSTDLIGYEEYITENDDPSWFHFDSNLKAALASLDRSGRTTRTIEEACVAERKGGSGERYRAIGIRFDGMTEFGFIYCKKAERTVSTIWDDSSDYEWESESYGDLILAASRIRY